MQVFRQLFSKVMVSHLKKKTSELFAKARKL